MNKYFACGLCLLALHNSAQALTLPASPVTAPAVDDERVDLNTPTTAGSRLNLTALQTPGSVESQTGEKIRQRGDASVQDAISRATGITRTGTPGDGGTSLQARGFTGQSSVLQLYDGQRMFDGAGTSTFPVDTWSVERVDVLRGPASVMYGQGATGAVINTLSKKPFEGQIENHIRLGYGSYDRQQQALDSGGSLTDTLSYRLNINRLRSNGFIDRGDSASDFVSAALRWQPADNLSVTLAHDYGDQRPQNDYGTPLINGQLHKSLRAKNYNVSNNTLHYNDQWTRLTSAWQINDNVTATNELSYLKNQRRWQNAESYNDVDGGLVRQNYLGIKHNQEQVGDRQTFTFKHTLFGLDSQTVTGVEYNRIRFHLVSNAPFDDLPGGGQPVDIQHPVPQPFVSDSPFIAQSVTTTKQLAAFAENRLQLSDKLSLITGVRRDYLHIDSNDLTTANRDADTTLTGNNWKAGLVYAITPDISVYAQYATSTDGVGSLISLSPSQQQFGLSTAKQAEVGFKQAFWDARGEWTLAAYHIVKQKLLVSIPGTDLKEQVGQQSSNGLEVSLDLQLPDAWQLQANAAIVRAQYDDFSEVVNGQAISRNGNRPVDVPNRTANLWLSNAVTDDIRAGAGVRYVSARYADTANTREVPSYTVADAAVSWKAMRNTTLGLELNNLFNRTYAVSQYNNGQQWLLGEPRSFFVTADYTF
ncbi:TonB-dependent receptor [Pseudomonas fluorescens]|jgi:iron complex outermembrane receptor protein|uniref:TonB-dependent receptor n=1 Tax=Pseudomonas fluorescens TaxID=294 RepID=UPI00099B2D2B|nr:TonB-dependent receptor [Pseudomonas fluorescens]OPB09843.1 TonB-dependent receptor [Pseudomonas fluorescens]WLH74441.1 TonB-dependent receptor [Pseudomonas fluorescens]